jgi:hypothetical protein
VDIYLARYMLDRYLDIRLDRWFILIESHVGAIFKV